MLSRLLAQTVAVPRRQTRSAFRVAARKARYERGRLRGRVARATGAGRPDPTDDIDVKNAVHAALSGAGVATKSISVEVSDRVAVLRGEVATDDDVRRIDDLVFHVPGVFEVENHLHLPGEPAPNKLDARRASAG